jgi:hypothetical protein
MLQRLRLHRVLPFVGHQQPQSASGLDLGEAIWPDMTHPHHRRRLAARVCTQDGFSAGGHSGLSLLNRGEQAFTENQAFPLRHAAVEGISELAHLNGELV